MWGSAKPCALRCNSGILRLLAVEQFDLLLNRLPEFIERADHMLNSAMDAETIRIARLLLANTYYTYVG